MTIDESKIREAFEEKNWTEIKSQDSWSVFKIMSEFVTGYETLSKIGPCVAIFGSARTKPDNKYYKMAEEAAYLLVKKIIFSCIYLILMIITLYGFLA